MDDAKTISFTYRNHKGVTEERMVTLDAVEFVREPGFGYQSGWFVSGFCHKKKERRSFAFSHIVMDSTDVPPFFKLITFSN